MKKDVKQKNEQVSYRICTVNKFPWLAKLNHAFL